MSRSFVTTSARLCSIQRASFAPLTHATRPYVAIGGIAAILHGSNRRTDDLDIGSHGKQRGWTVARRRSRALRCRRPPPFPYPPILVPVTSSTSIDRPTP